MRRLADGHLRAPVSEEVYITEQRFSVNIFRKRQVQPIRRYDIGAVRGEVGKCAFSHLLIHVRHRAIHAGVVEVVLVFPGDLRCRLKDGAVECDAGVCGVWLYFPSGLQRVIHDLPLIFLKLPDGWQATLRRIDVRNIEHANGLVRIIGVDGMNRLAAPANPEVAAIPLLHGGAGHRVGPLRGYEQGVFKGILVERGHGAQQLHPVLRGLCGFMQRDHRAFVKLCGLYSQRGSPRFSM